MADRIHPCRVCNHAPVVRRIIEEYPPEGRLPGGDFVAGTTIECDECGISFTEETRSEVIEMWNKLHGGADHGYKEMFYTVGEMLGISAQPSSPKQVWEDQMLPLLKEKLKA